LIPRLRQRRYRAAIAVALLVGCALLGTARSALPSRGEQSLLPPGAHERLHGVLARTLLKPPLRTNSRVRYSPDGRFILVQGSSGIYILARQPLHLISHLVAAKVYPAQFSADSQSVAVLSHDLTLHRVSSSDGQTLEEKALPVHDCLEAWLSPNSATVACLNAGFQLATYDSETGQPIYSTAADSYRAAPFAAVPLDLESAFSSPFGVEISGNLQPLANRGDRKFLALAFSPDGKSLIAGEGDAGFRVDLGVRKRSSLPENIRKRLQQEVSFVDAGRLLLLDRKHQNEPFLLSAQTGELLGKPEFKADSVEIASNPKYVLLTRAESPGVAVHDLEANHEMAIPLNLGADVYGGELAFLNDRGDLYIHRLGEVLPIATVWLPLDRLAALSSVGVDKDLTTLALSTDTRGGLYQIPSGRRLSSFSHFSAVQISPAGVLLLLPAGPAEAAEVKRYQEEGDKTVSAWFSDKKGRLRSGGATLLEYSVNFEFGRAFRGPVPVGSVAPFLPRSLDPLTGKELWSHRFELPAPLPFADPQGDTLVLGWHAGSDHAWSVARRYAALWEHFKHSKIAEQDTLFEAVDVRTGESKGAALVQIGSGPSSYTSAFAAGDTLVLVKDLTRLSLYSLTDGQLKARLAGQLPAVSAPGNLLALTDRPGHVVLYDSRTAEKLDEQLFSEPIEYLHFSADGERLLVVTEFQEVFLLDLHDLGKKVPVKESP
jgi:hypothetical protein